MNHSSPFAHRRGPVTAGVAGAALLLSCGAAAAATAQPPSSESLAYAVSTITELPGETFAMVTGDLNGDGRLDVVLPTRRSGSLQVFLARDGGGFDRTAYELTDGVENLAIGDVDRDGDLDVVTANIIDFAVTLHTNDGTGALTARDITPVNTYPSDVAIADVTGDSTPEILVADYFGERVVVTAREAAGAYAVAKTVATGSLPMGLVATDLTGDGIVDIATANRDSDDATILTGSTSGEYTTTTVPVGGSADDVSAGDVDGDGSPELVVRQQGGHTDVLDRSGGTWNASRLSLDEGSFVSDIVIADVTGDGRTDIVGLGWQAVHVWQSAAGTYERTDVPVPAYEEGREFYGTAAVAYDVDRNGVDDLLAVNNLDQGQNSLVRMTSNATSAQPSASVTVPTISGTPTVGQALLASASATPSSASIGYQWRRTSAGGTPVDIVGATSPSYTVTSSDVGSRISVVATASAGGYTSASESSALSATVTESTTPVGAFTVRATGGTRVGKTRTAASSLDADPSIRLSYRWQRANNTGGWVNLPDATDRAFELPPRVMKLNVRVLVTAQRGTSIRSQASAPLVILPGQHRATQLRITGDRTVGGKVTARFDDAVEPDGLRVTYDWTIGGNEIRASGRSITVPPRTAGKKVFVDIRLTAPGYSNQQLRSPAVTIRN